MTTPNLSVTDLPHEREEARDLQTLLFIDTHTSLGAGPKVTTNNGHSTNLTTTRFILDTHEEDAEPSPFRRYRYHSDGTFAGGAFPWRSP